MSGTVIASQVGVQRWISPGDHFQRAAERDVEGVQGAEGAFAVDDDDGRLHDGDLAGDEGGERRVGVLVVDLRALHEEGAVDGGRVDGRGGRGS